jgi:hypothetical protein
LAAFGLSLRSSINGGILPARRKASDASCRPQREYLTSRLLRLLSRRATRTAHTTLQDCRQFRRQQNKNPNTRLVYLWQTTSRTKAARASERN